MNVGDRVELELIDPPRNARRYYAVAVAHDPQLALFMGTVGVVLVVVRGRLEGRRIVRREAFGNLVELGARWRELLRRRLNHGYAIVRQTLAWDSGLELAALVASRKPRAPKALEVR